VTHASPGQLVRGTALVSLNHGTGVRARPGGGTESQLPRPPYARLQESLYNWYGNIGGVIYVLAVVATIMLAVLAWREHASRGLAVAAATMEVAALIVFLTVVLPVNSKFPVHGSGAVPAGWAGLRDRWEAGHATGFVLFTVAFIVLTLTALRLPPGPPARSGMTKRQPKAER
jgi:hypothetical protein